MSREQRSQGSKETPKTALQAQLQLLTRAEKAEEAISKAPHAVNCLATYNDCGWPRQVIKPEKCDCWKKDFS